MITKKDLKTKHGDDIILLFKGDEPFTEGENDSPLGMLIERDGKVLCNECGEWFEFLGAHVKGHKMTADEYKKKYGMNRITGLCSKAVSRRRSLIAIKNKKEGNMHRLTRGDCKKGAGKRKERRMQRRNARNICPEQIKRRMELAITKLGEENFSYGKVYELDEGLASYQRREHGTWAEAKKHFGLKVLKPYIVKDSADLIYDLRKYVLENETLPWIQKGNYNRARCKGFSHGFSCYLNHFGSFLKAQVTCGIKKVEGGIRERGKWQVIS